MTEPSRHPIDIEDIREAAHLIRGKVVRTPMKRSRFLSLVAGAEVNLKLETLQTTGSFKLRGATCAIQRLDASSRTRGVVCCSTGNHGRAVAHAAQLAGIPATVCLSRSVPAHKSRAIAALGARIVIAGVDQDEAQRETERLVAEDGLVEIPPFDHPDVVAGQGTIGLEILEDCPHLDGIAVPLSGGGLAGGIALAAKSINPAIRVIGYSACGEMAMIESMRAGVPVALPERPTLADALHGGIGENNRLTLELCRALLDEVRSVPEVEIYRAIRTLLVHEGVVAEGAAAIGVSGLFGGDWRDASVAVIVSGGNIDPAHLAAIRAGKPVIVEDDAGQPPLQVDPQGA